MIPAALRKSGQYVAMAAIWAALALFFGLMSHNFLSARAFLALANRIPTLMVISTGMTLVLIVGGIDLSVGSIAGLCGALAGVVIVDDHAGFLTAVLLCLALGASVGAVNGIISVCLGIPSFIVTLGMLEIARGLSYLLTHSQTKYIGAAVEGLSDPMGFLGVSPAFLIAILVVAAGQIALSRTVFGRYLVAIGANEPAARLSGIDPRVPKIAVFALAGMLAGLGGVFLTSRLGSSDPNAGIGLELSAIAAAVIGGTSLTGGKGSVVKTLFGVLVVATLEAGLAQIGASDPMKRVATGLAIILAVALDAWRQRWARRGWV